MYNALQQQLEHNERKKMAWQEGEETQRRVVRLMQKRWTLILDNLFVYKMKKFMSLFSIIRGTMST